MRALAKYSTNFLIGIRRHCEGALVFARSNLRHKMEIASSQSARTLLAMTDMIHDKLSMKISTVEGRMSKYETYSIEIAGVKRELRLFAIKPGLRIAILNILGDTELVQASARGLAEKVKDVDYDIIVTAEAKSIPIAHALSVETKKPYVVLRKTYKPYMGDALKAETLSITTGQPQVLILDEKDLDLIQGKKVLIVDDVISTGSTLQGMHMILDKANATVAGEAAILTEGDRAQWMHIHSLGHLPLFTD